MTIVRQDGGGWPLQPPHTEMREGYPLRRISAVVLSVLLMLALASSAALAKPPAGKGQPGSEPGGKQTGKPTDPNCWGQTASHMATTLPPGGLGEHASSQETLRQGVGNVARNDGADETRPSDDAEIVGPQMRAPPCDEQ